MVAAHDGQFRKGAEPAHYATHPVHIALMLTAWGFDEDVICAGLLHDVVEDCEGWTIERLEQEFGTHIASLVDQLTEDKSLSWKERKAWAVDHVPHMSPEAASVKAADKLHNLRCLLEDLESAEDDDIIWSRFRGGRERTLAMDEKLVEALITRVDPRLGKALRETFEAVVAQDGRARGVTTGS